MQPETPRVWVRWRLRVRGSTIEVAESSSDSGVATPIDSADERLLDVTDVRLASTFSQFAIGSTAAAQLAAARNSLAGWHDEGIQGQPSVALFVVPPPGLEGFRWDGLSQVIDAIEPGHDAPVVVVTEPTSEFADATSLTLPLRVAIVGDRATEVATTLFANSSWFGRPGLATVDVVTTSDPAAHLPAQHYDVLIVESEARRRRQSVGASLAVVLDAGARKPGDPVAPVTRGPMLAPVGRSTFVFDGFDPGGVNDLLEHLTHDVALHDIAAQLSGSAYLLSTPTAVHDLHIRDLVVDMALSVHESEVTDPTLPALPIDPAEYDSPPLAVRFDRLSFERESGGLFPIWDLMTGSWRSRVIAARGVVPGSSREASVGERVVDITMRRDRAERGATLPFVRPGEGLVADGTYHLRVGIGRPSSFSIMRGEPVSIDELLPTEPGGHRLEIVVFPGDFTAPGPTLARVFLPNGGVVTPVEFAVRAPASTGLATARVAIYHRTNLIQTFLVEAEVVDEPSAPVEFGVRSSQDHSVTTDWSDLAALGRRRFSIVLNDNGGTHSIYVKDSEGPRADWRLGDEVQTELVKPIRDLLNAHVDAAGSANADPAGDLRALAKAGQDLAYRLDERIGGGDAGLSMFRRLASQEDEIVQVVRVDAHHSIPWALMYDWELPRDIDAAPVCWGVGADDRRCTHRNARDVVCARGFWGVRHRIEEMFGHVASPALTVPIADGRLSLSFASGVQNPIITTFRTDLARHASVSDVGQNDSLLSRLWDAAAPPLCAVVGHMQPDGSMACGTSEARLSKDDVTGYDRRENDEHTPRPLLMLLVCESGAVTPKMVSSVALSFSRRTAALVCTESEVRSSNIKDFGTAFVDGLGRQVSATADFSKSPLATALQEARTSLVATGSLAGLAFLAFGPAALTLVRR